MMLSVAVIREGAAALPAGIRLWAKPGRVLVASGASFVVQMQQRRGNALYVNNGIYGALSDAGAPRFRFSHRLSGRAAAGQALRYRNLCCSVPFAIRQIS